MRIFEVLEATANASVGSNRTWYYNLYEPLIELGCDVVLVSAQDGRQAMRQRDQTLRAAFSRRLLETFKREQRKQPIDLFFSYLMDGMVEESVIDEIRKSGVPTCNFSCNNAHQFHLVDGLSPHFDYNLHSEKDSRDKFLAIGANPLWWPMASNPRHFRPVDVPRLIDVSFVGENYALRARYISHLLEHGVAAHAYGPGWHRRSHWRAIAKHYQLLAKTVVAASAEQQARASSFLADSDFRRILADRYPNNLHPPVSDDELVALYSRSKISLGFLEVFDRHDPNRPVTQHLHLREFEAPMCGALYCTGFTDELAELFEPDREVVVYRSQHELLDKIRFFLSHPSDADKIRAAGRLRALSEHTYQRRFETLFGSIGLKGG